MQRISYILILSLLIANVAVAQVELQRLNDQAKNAYLKPEEIDRIVPQLKGVALNPSDNTQKNLLFDTYRLVAARYAGNNHFKQAFYLYKDYLDLKEKTLAKEKAGLISANVAENKEKEAKMIAGLKSLKEDIIVLESSEQQLKKRQADLIRNTSMLLLVLSGIFVFIFLRFSGQIKHFRAESNQFKKQLLGHEKMALAGRLKDPLILNSQKQLEITRLEVSSLQKLLKQIEPAVAKEKMNDFEKAKESFIKAETDLKVLSTE